MNIVVIKEKLKEGLDAITRISGEHENLPILRNVLIKATQNEITLTTTNLEMGIHYTLAGKVIEDGSATTPVQVLSQMINNVPHDRINIENKDNTLTVTTDNYNANIQGLPAEDFPIVPTIKNKNTLIEIDATTFRRGLEQVALATQFSDLRPELNSVLFSLSGAQFKLVATDSFRLAEKSFEGNQLTTHDTADFQVLVPLKTTHELLRIIKSEGKIAIYHDENQILFETDRFKLLSRLIEGNFPDYQEIVPEDFTIEAVVEKDEFIHAVKLVSVLSSSIHEVSVGVEKSKKAIRIRSGENPLGENTYLLPAKVAKAEGTLPKEASFNWRYLLDGLRAFEEKEIFFGMNEDNRPAIVRVPQKTPSSYFYILMPILKE